eukprot:142267_1
MINAKNFTVNHLNPINNNTSVSILLGIQSRNTILNTIKNMLNNLQNVLFQYNTAFTFPIQSITNKLNNSSTQSTIFQSISNDIQTCLLLQDKMWKDIITQKTAADSELYAVQQNIINLQQSNTLYIKPQQVPPNTPFIILKTLPNHNTYNSSQTLSSVHCNNSVPLVSNRSLGSTTSIIQSIESNASGPKIKTPDNKKIDKRKRKRRGYNGPYSDEEKKFMINYNKNNKCETTNDIVNLSNAMETKFKVKRSPYGLSQKMYQMNLINSRLKALFQRQFANESKQVSQECVNESIDNNEIKLSIKRRTFMAEESNYINQLIANHINEKPRKLFWRFTQKFTEWNNDSKSYQKFYHKYWTLTNDKNIVDNVSGNHDKNQRKRLSNLNVNQPCKRIKLS